MEQGEDTPELGGWQAAVIGAVCLFSGTAAVFGLATVPTALITLSQPHPTGFKVLVFVTVVCAIAGFTVYFLAGGAEGAVRGHRLFEALLYWAAASCLVSASLAIASLAVRSAFA